MSYREPKEPYVFQPIGMDDAPRWKAQRVYAIGGMHPLATVSGLTKAEADAMLAALLAARAGKASDA